MNNRLIGIKLGAPIREEGFKLGVELTSSVAYNRNTRNNLIGGYATTGATGTDNSATEKPAANPAGVLLLLDVPMSFAVGEAGEVKITPEVTTILNRYVSYDAAKEELNSDLEFIGGASVSWKVNKVLSLSANGAYGMVDNKNSKVGSYGVAYNGNPPSATNTSSNLAPTVPGDTCYASQGLIAGLGGTYKVGPGSVALDLKYGSAVDAASDSSKTLTSKNDILGDVRYTWNVHPKFSIQPRWRLYMTMYDKKSGHISQKMENRPELILTGQF
jgi:hypothetical protein